MTDKQEKDVCVCFDLTQHSVSIETRVHTHDLRPTHALFAIWRIEFCCGSPNINRGAPEQSVCNISEASVNFLTVKARAQRHNFNVSSFGDKSNCFSVFVSGRTGKCSRGQQSLRITLL